MTRIYDDFIFNGIVYLVVDDKLNFMYIGSTTLPIKELEFNHRNFRMKRYTKTRFRAALESKGSSWDFSAISEMRCTKETLEYYEGLAIRAAEPQYNVDDYPYEQSIERKRIPHPSHPLNRPIDPFRY